MKVNTFNYDNINEKLYEYQHDSGLRAFVIPKIGYKKIYATFATRYGSLNNKFIDPDTNEEIRVPDGIAHFLEHKLFEQENEDVMEKFSKFGAIPNAYTGFAQTVYFFSCTENFPDNFETLLNFVQSPYLTDENVENEKGIIAQEINMLKDRGSRVVFFNLLNALYKNNPVKIEIGGTIESISKINKELLYKCYNKFYHPSNMMILVVGDVNYNEVFKMIDANIKTKEFMEPVKRIYDDEPDEVNQKLIEDYSQISRPILLMGYKDNDVFLDGAERIKKEICMSILLEMIMGKSSKLYNEMYNMRLIDNSFDYEYTIEESYAFSSFGGEVDDPKKVKERILDGIRKYEINENDFDRIRKAHIGAFIKHFNSVGRISDTFIEMYFKGVKSLDVYKILENITIDDVKKHLKEHFNENRLAVSIVYPKA